MCFCVILFGRETWPVKMEDVIRLEWNDARMVRWMCKVRPEDRIYAEKFSFPRVQPRKTWNEAVRSDLKEWKVIKDIATDRNTWKSFIRNRTTHASMENRRYNEYDDVDIADLRILLSDWLRVFWLITQEPEISQI